MLALQTPVPTVPNAYKVQLDAFEGPLDLLLFLIRKDEVDLHNIPIASITEQYIAYVKEIESLGQRHIDIDTAGEFLVMAATLMEIKSRMLMPKIEGAAPMPEGSGKRELEDPRSELVRQLLEYKRYRDAANGLEGRAEEWRRRFPVVRAGVDDVRLQAALDAAPDMEMEDLDVLDLVEAFRRIAETVNFDRLGDHQVTYDDTPIELHSEDIVSSLRSESGEPKEMSLQAMFAGRSRGEMVGLFLASATMFFGSLFSAYVMLRAGSLEWPGPLAQFPWLETALLLGASASFSEARIRLISAQSLGIAFVAIRLLNDAILIRRGLVPSASLQLACWYTLGAVHTAFVFGAAVFSGWLAGPSFAMKAAQRERWLARIEATRRYWIFVALVWLALVGGFFI